MSVPLKMKFSPALHSQKLITIDPEKMSKNKRAIIQRTLSKPHEWKYESLNFDVMLTKVYKDRIRYRGDFFMEWIAYALIGICIGFIMAIMAHLEALLVHEKKLITDYIIDGDSDNLVLGWLFYSGISALLVAIASSMTVYMAPGASGSGNAELIAYLNGVNYPKIIGFNTLVVKIFGVLLAVSGGLCVGKEGPLAHIGANIGAAIVYFPLPRFESLRNDVTKRSLIAAGLSAGVSAAFAAPIGGTLFAYEMSKPNEFWKFSVLWKSFFSCAIAVFFSAVFGRAVRGEPINEVAPSELKFGQLNVESPRMGSTVAAIILGIICGFLGAFFVVVNSQMANFRKRFIQTKCTKVFEAVLFAFVTSTAFYWVPKY